MDQSADVSDRRRPSMVIAWGSNTGFTEAVATAVHEGLMGLGLKVDIVDIADSSFQDLAASYEVLILGVPTWHIGELQDDWDRCFDQLPQVNLTGKKVAFFGCGDARGYADTFQDAMGILWDQLRPTGAQLVGKWPAEGYDQVLESRAFIEDRRFFVGLAIDEHTQSDLTDERIERWLEILQWDLGIEGSKPPKATPLPAPVLEESGQKGWWGRLLSGRKS